MPVSLHRRHSGEWVFRRITVELSYNVPQFRVAALETFILIESMAFNCREFAVFLQDRRDVGASSVIGDGDRRSILSACENFTLNTTTPLFNFNEMKCVAPAWEKWGLILRSTIGLHANINYFMTPLFYTVRLNCAHNRDRLRGNCYRFFAGNQKQQVANLFY